MKSMQLRDAELVVDSRIQASLFDHRDRKRSKALMKSLDTLNTRMGSGTLKYAAEGLIHNPRWQTVFKKRSPSYTTNWDQLLEVS